MAINWDKAKASANAYDAKQRNLSQVYGAPSNTPRLPTPPPKADPFTALKIADRRDAAKAKAQKAFISRLTLKETQSEGPVVKYNLSTPQRVLAAADAGAESAIGGSVGALQTGVQWLGEKIGGLFGTQKGLEDPETAALVEKLAKAGAFGNVYVESDPILDPEKLSESASNKMAAATEDTSGIGKFALEGISSATNMGTGAALSMISGLPFTTQMGIQAGGAAAIDAKEQGKSLDQQMLYGVGTGLAVKATEGLGGIGASALAKGLTSKAATTILSKLPSALSTWATTSGAKVAGKILSSFGSEAVEEGIDYNTDRFLQILILDNDVPFDVKQMAYQMLQGGAVGGVFGGGQVLTSGAMNSLAKNSATQPPVAQNQATTPQPLQSPVSAPASATAQAQTVQPQASAQAGTQPITDGLGAADAGFDVTGNKLTDLINEYGSIKQGEGPVTTERLVELPKQTSEDKNVMQTLRTIMEAPVVTNGTAEALESMVPDEKFSRFVNTDKMALQAAKDTILDEGYAQSLQKFSNAMSKGQVSKNNIALGFTLLSASEAVGDSKTSVNIIVDMMDNIRDAAQSLQAVRMLKKMQPEYQLYGVMRSVNNFKSELQQKYGDKAPNLKIDENLAQAYLDALFAKDDAKAKVALEGIYKNIASQVPATFEDKWNAWRYTAMLFNPVTHIKNIASNFVFRGERFIKHVLSASVQTAANKTIKALGGQGFEQNTTLLTRKDSQLIEDAAKDYINVSDSIMRYGKYDDAKNKIEEYRTIYGTGGKTTIGNLLSNTLGKGAELARKTNTSLLETEDLWVSKYAYINALAGYLKANGATMKTAPPELLGKARGYAITEAQKASYRDSNAFSDFVSSFMVYNGKNPIGKGWNALQAGVLPFRRTPANVLVRGVEYSPIGLAKTIFVDSFRLAKGDISASQYIDHLSEGLVGTALTGLGVLLSSMGILTVGSTGDDREDKLKQTQGNQYFAIQIGDKSYTIDWLTPAMMPVFLGASLFNLKTDESKDGVQAKDVLKVASDITAPLLETSMLSGLNDYLEGFGYAKQQDQNLLVYGVTQAALNYLGQAIPSIGGRIARTLDDTRRTSFTNPKGQLPNDVQYFLQNQLGKIPFAENTKQPYVDQWGRTQDNGNVGQRLLQNFLSPGYGKQINVSPMENELQRLYRDYAKENEVNVLPPVTIKKFFTNNGEDIYMTAQEYTKYKKTSGQYAYDELNKLTSSQDYKLMSDEDKADAVSDVWSAAAEKAKTEVMESRGDKRLPTSDIPKMQTYVDVGISEDKAYKLYRDVEALDLDLSTAEGKYSKIQTILKQDLTQSQKTSLIATMYTGHDDEGNVTTQSLLPYLKNPEHLISLYVTSKDPQMISMSVPKSVTQNKIEYELTDAEKELFKSTYIKFFNKFDISKYNADAIARLRDKALAAAKQAVISGR
jgi:hypothetical protein